MPAPHALLADGVYALTAYILHLNDLVPNEFVADRGDIKIMSTAEGRDLTPRTTGQLDTMQPK
jgi:hypothetical protein